MRAGDGQPRGARAGAGRREETGAASERADAGAEKSSARSDRESRAAAERARARLGNARAPGRAETEGGRYGSGESSDTMKEAKG